MAICNNNSSCKEQIRELLRVNLCWKDDYDKLQEKNKILKQKLDRISMHTISPVDAMSIHEKEDIEMLKQQVRVYKDDSFKERNKNEILTTKCQELEVRLKNAMHKLENARIRQTSEESGSYVSRQPYVISREDIREAQRQATMLHSVPGLHVPGTFIAYDVERDNRNNDLDDDWTALYMQQMYFKRSNSF